MAPADQRHGPTVGEIAQLLTADIDTLVLHLLPAGKQHGPEWVEASTRHGGLGDSLSVRMSGGRAGIWGHFGANAGGDLLDLIAYVQTGGDKIAAIKWAKQWLGMADGAGCRGPERAAAIERARKAADGRRRKEARDRETRAAHAQRLWLSAPKVEPDDVVDRYLSGRHIGLLQLGRRPGCLHAGQAIRHRDGTTWPAMLACILNGDGAHVATHRTFLTEAGRKAPVDPVKMVLGDYAGGYIPLWKGGARQTLRELPDGVPVLISEGIEDGLSAALLQPEARVIAAISIGNIGAVALPPQVRDVVLVAQNDAPGSKAAEAFDKAVQAHIDRGRTVRVARPPAGIKDFNEWVQKLRAAA